MHKTAIDLIPILDAIETVCNSTHLSPAQREAIYTEMHHSLPDKMFCPNSQLTLHLIQTILRNKDGSTKPAQVKSAKTAKKPEHGTSSAQKPTRKTTLNARGKSKAPADASQSS